MQSGYKRYGKKRSTPKVFEKEAEEEPINFSTEFFKEYKRFPSPEEYTAYELFRDMKKKYFKGLHDEDLGRD